MTEISLYFNLKINNFQMRILFQGDADYATEIKKTIKHFFSFKKTDYVFFENGLKAASVNQICNSLIGFVILEFLQNISLLNVFLLNVSYTKRFLLQNVSGHKAFPVTKRSLLQNVSCHTTFLLQNVSLINRILQNVI